MVQLATVVVKVDKTQIGILSFTKFKQKNITPSEYGVEKERIS